MAKDAASLPRFLIDPSTVREGRVRLSDAEAKHARVRRLRGGDAVVVFDGAGLACAGRIESINRRFVEIQLGAPLPERQGESHLDLTLAIAALKADKLDWIVEKTTELGVCRVRPFLSRFSLARPAAARRARWAQIALAAAKQCGRSVVPVIEEAVSLTEILADASPCRLMVWEGAKDRASAAAQLDLQAPEQAIVVVGPEGGFAAEEVEAATAAGFDLVGLGPRILRAETAAVVIVALLQQLWGDLHGPA